MPLDDYLKRAAHHDAGHAVAATVSGIAPSPVRNAPNAAGLWIQPRARSFIAFAGVWADARYRWGDTYVDGTDKAGDPFADYVQCSWELTVGDNAAMTCLPAALRELLGDSVHSMTIPLPDAWLVELATLWPTVQSVAQRFVAAPTWRFSNMCTLLNDPDLSPTDMRGLQNRAWTLNRSVARGEYVADALTRDDPSIHRSHSADGKARLSGHPGDRHGRND